jgi:integrase
MTVNDYAPQWLASLQVKDSTKSFYGSIVRNQLGWLGDLRMTRIQPPDIRQLLAEREREEYSGRTRRAILDVLRMIFRMAESDGLVERNPAALVAPPKVESKEPVHFTAEQARAFLEAAKDDNLYSLYAVALATGMRRGELLATTWTEVDVGAGVLYVRRAKTAAGTRAIPLAAWAKVALGNEERRPGRIWPYDPSYVTRHVGVICARAGLPRLTFHGLRHSTASILLAEGVPIEIIKQILGHSRAIMSEHYARADEPQKREALERLGRAVSG